MIIRIFFTLAINLFFVSCSKEDQLSEKDLWYSLNIDNYEMPELPESNPANDYGPYKGSAANHNYVIKNVIDTLKGRTTATTNAFEGLKVVEIIEEIYKVRNEQFNLR